jgi:hypothetical protein
MHYFGNLPKNMRSQPPDKSIVRAVRFGTNEITMGREV